MANRYATATVHYHNTSTGKDEQVPAGALRDSTHQAVVQMPSAFRTTPLVAGPDCTGVLAQYLLTYPSGP